MICLYKEQIVGERPNKFNYHPVMMDSLTAAYKASSVWPNPMYYTDWYSLWRGFSVKLALARLKTLLHELSDDGEVKKAFFERASFFRPKPVQNIYPPDESYQDALEYLQIMIKALEHRDKSLLIELER